MADYYDEGYGFVYFTPAWHRKAPVLDHRPRGFADAAVAAGITWDTVSKPVASPDENGVWRVIPGMQNIARDDNGESLHVAPRTYENISNAQWGEIVEYVYQGAGLGLDLFFETMISMRGGRVLAATMIIDDTDIHGDPSAIRRFLVSFTSHDGSMKLRIGSTEVRVVCANTTRAANESFERTGRFGEIKHTANWRDTLPAVTEQVRRAITQSDDQLARYDEMARSTISHKDLEDFIARYVQAELKRVYRDRQPDAEIVAATSRKVTDSFMSVYDGALGEHTMEGIRGTKWGVFQAVTQMRDHHTRHKGSDRGDYDSLIGRTLVYGDAPKTTAMKILASL